MDDRGWEQPRPWLAGRSQLPVGPLFFVIDGATRGGPGRPRRCAPSSGESRLGRAFGAGFRRTSRLMRTRSSSRARACRSHHSAPAGASESRYRSIYRQGINPEEIIIAVRSCRAPMMSASAGLKL